MDRKSLLGFGNYKRAAGSWKFCLSLLEFLLVVAFGLLVIVVMPIATL